MKVRLMIALTGSLLASTAPALAQQGAFRPVLHGNGQVLARPDQPIGTAGQLRSRPDLPLGGQPNAVPGFQEGRAAGPPPIGSRASAPPPPAAAPAPAVPSGPPAGSGQAYPDGPH